MPHWSSVLEFVDNTNRATGAYTVPDAVQLLAERFNPDAVSIDRVSADFNSVVEISASLCLSVFHAGVFWKPFEYVVSGQDLADFFSSDPTPFASPILNSLRASAGNDGAYVVAVNAVPQRLKFSDTHAQISYAAAITVERISPRPTSFREAMVAKAAIFGSATPGPAASVPVQIEAPYGLLRQDDIAFVDIVADLSQANIDVDLSGGDAARLFAGLAVLNGLDIAAHVRSLRLRRLAIPISPVGNNIPGFAREVTQFEDYYVGLAVVESDGRQALAVVFDVRKGCQGELESVEHFVGPFDYGVISDEYVLQQCFAFRHANGDFPAFMPASARISLLDPDGDPIDATLSGLIDIKSFRSLSIEYDSNLGAEIFLIAGGGELSQLQAVLDDGTILDSNELPLPNIQNLDWSFRLTPELAMAPTSLPSAVEFQRRISDGVTRHLGKPFALYDDSIFDYRWPVPTVDYFRLWSFPASLFCLGTIPAETVSLTVTIPIES